MYRRTFVRVKNKFDSKSSVNVPLPLCRCGFPSQRFNRYSWQSSLLDNTIRIDGAFLFFNTSFFSVKFLPVVVSITIIFSQFRPTFFYPSMSVVVFSINNCLFIFLPSRFKPFSNSSTSDATSPVLTL